MVFVSIWCNSKCRQRDFKKELDARLLRASQDRVGVSEAPGSGPGPRSQDHRADSHSNRSQNSSNQNVRSNNTSSGHSSSGQNTGDRRIDYSIDHEENESLIIKKGQKRKGKAGRGKAGAAPGDKSGCRKIDDQGDFHCATTVVCACIAMGFFVAALTIYVSVGCHSSRAVFNQIANEIYETVVDYSNELADARDYLKEVKSGFGRFSQIYVPKFSASYQFYIIRLS